jgi:hypothetical protein
MKTGFKKVLITRPPKDLASFRRFFYFQKEINGYGGLQA